MADTVSVSASMSTLPVAAHELRLKPATADRDLGLFDVLSGSDGSAPSRLTHTLKAGFEPVADDSMGGFDRLGIVERQAALFRLAFAHGRWPVWFTTGCASCGKLIDARVGSDEFACRPVRAGFPFFEIECDGERRRFMAPNGRHEHLLAEAAEDAAERLALSCACTPMSAGEAGRWAPAFGDAIGRDAGRQTISLPMTCPHCASPTEFWFDPYEWIGRHVGASLRDVHLLAHEYGWSESAILAMPHARRQAYLAMIGHGP